MFLRISVLHVIVLSLAFPSVVTSQWQSSRLYFGTNGRLVYVADSAGNRIPDFSNAGYMGGGVTIPTIPVVKTISPIAGDNTARVQSAIDSVGGLPLDQNGFRGTVLLTAGVYRIYGTLQVKYSGVVLRGAGEGSDSTQNTILKALADTPHQRAVLVAGGGSESAWRDSVSGTKTNVLTDSIQVGSRTFRIQNPAPYVVGDNIIIYHPCTNGWLQAINYGGTHSGEPGSDSTDVPWSVGSQPILYNRYITRISGDTITVDVPVFNHLVRRFSQSYIYKYSRSNIKTKIGIENLRVDIQTAGGTDENHAWDAIRFVQVENAWSRHCTTLHFGQAGFEMATASRITIDSCSALDPVSVVTGERRYNFNMYTASQQILVSNCRTSNGRHDYVSNGTTWTSGCVFLNCTSTGTNASSEGHRRWTTGFLYDNITYLSANTDFVLGLYNRGFYGTSHGWGAAHSVLWNCSAVGLQVIVQQPPTAQNYAIGCKGTVTGVSPPAPFNHPAGFIEGSNTNGLNPYSLYLAQLAERLGSTSVSENHATAPIETELYQNYPNPFNPTTTIKFRISNTSRVKLEVFDLLGRSVATLVDEEMEAGSYAKTLSATNVSSGVYFYRLQVGAAASTRKMLLMR